MTETVAVLLPTRGRAAQMTERVTALLDQELPRGVDLVVVLAVCEDDLDTALAAETLAKDDRVAVTVRPAGTNAVQGWNQAFGLVAFADWFVLGADDIVWHPGWLAAALGCAEKTAAQVVGLNDGHTNLKQYGAHYMVHRTFIDQHLGGAFIPPMYQSWWFDREICEKAHGLGLYVPCYEAMAQHLHPEWKDAPMDATYELGYPLHDADRDLYQARKKAGWPVNYPATPRTVQIEPKAVAAAPENKMLATEENKAPKPRKTKKS